MCGVGRKDVVDILVLRAPRSMLLNYTTHMVRLDDLPRPGSLVDHLTRERPEPGSPSIFVGQYGRILVLTDSPPSAVAMTIKDWYGEHCHINTAKTADWSVNYSIMLADVAFLENQHGQALCFKNRFSNPAIYKVGPKPVLQSPDYASLERQPATLYLGPPTGEHVREEKNDE